VPPLVLYFNELSAPPSAVTTGELEPWRSWALTLATGLRQVKRYHHEYSLAIPCGQWHALYAGMPLSAWMAQWLGRDHYRQMLAKIQEADQPDDLLREVYFVGGRAIGLTFARLAQSWTFSFPIADSPWLNAAIPAQDVCVDDAGIIHETDCQIQHISCEDHTEYWCAALADWGRHIAESCEIAVVDGHPIDMYLAPREHGHPHVHLVGGIKRHTMAKYRIDVFERMAGPPDWDPAMRRWIESHRDELLLSWQRCMHGEWPYKIGHPGV
jgi:hypothetical protein